VEALVTGGGVIVPCVPVVDVQPEHRRMAQAARARMENTNLCIRSGKTGNGI
jgi:hypothetical protein